MKRRVSLPYLQKCSKVSSVSDNSTFFSKISLSSQSYERHFSVLLLEKSSDSDRKDLLSELELMKKLKSHPHVIRLMGCVTETGNLQLD